MMFHLLKRNFYGAALLAFMLALAPAAGAQEAEKVTELSDMLLERSDKVIDQLAARRADNSLDSAAALEIIQQEMSPILNFPRLTQRAMGKHWRRAPDEAKDAVTRSFTALLENTYAKVLSKYSGQQSQLVSAKAGAKKAIEVVLKITGDGEAVEVNYVFQPDKSGDYLVSDIKVEGISLVANYRRQFAAFIQKHGVEKLALQLEQMAQAKIQ